MGATSAVAAVACAGLVATACAEPRAPVEGRAPVEESVPDDRSAPEAAPSIERIYAYGMSFGSTMEAIRRELGPPPEADTVLEPNRHVPEATDSLFTLRYPGLAFELNRPGPVENELLTSVRLTDPERRLPGGLTVGRSTRLRLSEMLGEPSAVRRSGDTTVLSYETPGVAAERFVEFHVAGDTLRRVVWLPYVD